MNTGWRVAVALDVLFDPPAHTTLDPVELVVIRAGEGAVGVPVGYEEANCPPMITEGRGPTEVTNSAAL